MSETAFFPSFPSAFVGNPWLNQVQPSQLWLPYRTAWGRRCKRFTSLSGISYNRLAIKMLSAYPGRPTYNNIQKRTGARFYHGNTLHDGGLGDTDYAISSFSRNQRPNKGTYSWPSSLINKRRRSQRRISRGNSTCSAWAKAVSAVCVAGGISCQMPRK